jgi:hypothetical protein
MSTDSSPKQSWIVTLAVLIGAPLLVTVVGGLTVEWLKPREKNATPPEKPLSGKAEAAPLGAANPVFFGKWAENNHKLYHSLDFHNDGKLVRKKQFDHARFYTVSANDKSVFEADSDDNDNIPKIRVNNLYEDELSVTLFTWEKEYLPARWTLKESTYRYIRDDRYQMLTRLRLRPTRRVLVDP